MALPKITTLILDSDPTGVANEFLVRLQHDADFPTGPADPVTNIIPTVHHGAEVKLKITAADGPTFRAACRASGNAWATAMVAMIAGAGSKIVGGLHVGDTIGPY